MKKFERKPAYSARKPGDWWGEIATRERLLAREQQQAGFKKGYVAPRPSYDVYYPVLKAEEEFFARQPYYVDFANQLETYTRRYSLDTATGADLLWVSELYYIPPTPFERFIALTKKIVRIWADNLPDLTKRAAMLELYDTPRI